MWLRAKIGAVFALAIGAPLALALAAVSVVGGAAVREHKLDELTAAARGIAVEVEGDLARDFTLLKTVSGLSVLQEIVVADDGREVSRVLAEVKSQNPSFVLLLATDARGRVVASTTGSGANGSLAADEGFRIAASGRMYQSAMAFREAPGLTTISFGVPVIAAYDKQTVIGTLIGTIDVGALSKVVKARSTLASNASAVALFASSDGQAGHASHPDAVQFGPVKEPTIVDWRGESYFVAAAPSQGKELVRDPGFVVKAGIPTAPAFASLDSILALIAAAGLLAAAGLGAFAWRWSTPLVRLGTAMVRLSRGDANVRAPDVAPSNTFAPMTRAFESVRQLKAVHEWLAARERDLLRAKEEAEHALHEKSEHLASLARALKGELATIVELSEAINAETLKAAAGGTHIGRVKDISRSGTQLLAVINDLFDLSEAEAGHTTLNEAEIDLALLVREATAVMNDAADKARVSLACDGTGAPLWVRADAHKLKQVMFNLLSNAVKFTPEQGHVRVALKLDIDGRPAIVVQDTGIGMPVNLAPHAAAAFGATAPATHGKHGAGLGLPLVRRLVDLHGGRVDIESEPARGTTVTVTLPAARLVMRDEERLTA